MEKCTIWKITIVFFVLIVSAGAITGQKRTVVYKYPDGKDAVTFNPARIKLKDLKYWMQLSPVISPYNEMLVPPTIEKCLSEDHRYHNCNHDGDIDENNARVTLGDIAKKLRILKEGDYPADLHPVVQYFVRIQSFGLARQEHRLDFFLSNDPGNLEKKIDTVDPSVSCREIIGKIRASNDHKERAKLARFDWENCVWSAESANIGSYPKDVWNHFLAEYGISENVTEESPD